jgi:RNA polymerase sigma factor (sigma-70 family)
MPDTQCLLPDIYNMIDRRSDEELIPAYLGGEGRAFVRLVDRYQARLINFADGKVDNFQDAQDIVQETWFKAWKNLNNFDETRKFSSWLYKICQNCCFDNIESRKRNRFNLFSQIEDKIKKVHFGAFGEIAEIEYLRLGAFSEIAESVEVLARILAVLTHPEHRLWYCFVTRARRYEAISQDEKLFRNKTEEELRTMFVVIWHKVWEQRNKEVAKWLPKKKPQINTDNSLCSL